MPKSMRRIQVRWDGIFLALLTIAALSMSCSHETTTTPPTPVRVTSVGTFEGSGGIRYSANINAFTQVTLAFKSGGYVDNIAQRKGADGRIRVLQMGDRVTPGEVLAHIRESDYLDKVNSAKAQLAQVQAAYDKSELDFERASKLLSTDSLTKAQFDAAKASFDSNAAGLADAKANLQLATTAMSDCSLRSPLNGWVVERDAEIGALAATGTQAFIVADTHLVKAVFGVPDTTVQSATLSVGAGKIEQPTTVVPLSAVVRSSKRADGFAVFVIENQGGKSFAHERVVEIGDTLGNMIGVPQGLKVGESVVVVGGTQIKDGDEIRVIP